MALPLRHGPPRRWQALRPSPLPPASVTHALKQQQVDLPNIVIFLLQNADAEVGCVHPCVGSCPSARGGCTVYSSSGSIMLLMRQAHLKAVHQRAPVQCLASRLEAEHRLCQQQRPLRVAATLRGTLDAHPRPTLLRPGKALQRRLRKDDYGSLCAKEAVSKLPKCMIPRMGMGQQWVDP